MKYNFDEIIDRNGTNCVKNDNLNLIYGRDDLLPLWIADMDFKCSPKIIDALRKRVEHGIFGYTTPGDDYYNAIINWQQRRHNWQIKKEWITFVPGVVKGVAFAIDAFTKEGDKILIQPPVYHPFKMVTEGLGRVIVNNPLKYENGTFEMDLEGLKELTADDDCKMMILCNPHNPGGKVWSPEVLTQVADICYDNNVLVISDEIHADLTLPGNKHRPFATISAKAKQNCVTLMAPSKTFNVAGLISSFAIIPNDGVREKYMSYIEPRELFQGTLFGYEATKVAFNECEDWLDEALAYIQENIRFVEKYLAREIPQIKPMIPEASFLIWLDCTALNLPQEQLVSLFVEKARLALNDGAMFGVGGEGFMRFNIGSPRSVIEKALDNLKKAIDS